MDDLFQEPETQEEKWQREIKECQAKFQQRVQQAIELARFKTKRKALYQTWRKELGDDIARESAKFAEALIAGQIRRPKWFN